MDDEQLIGRILEGDELAAAMLVSLYGAQLAGFARAIGRDLSDTDREIVCETAIEKAVRKMNLFEPAKGTLFGWLRAFVRTEVANWRRSMQRLQPLTEEEPTPEPERSEGSSKVQEMARALVPLMGTLRQTDQLILTLRDLDGLSYKEIAARFDVSAEACRQRHLRAAARLREAAANDPTFASLLKGAKT